MSQSVAAAILLAIATSANAEPTESELKLLRSELDLLRAEQQQRVAASTATQVRIDKLAARLDALESAQLNASPEPKARTVRLVPEHVPADVTPIRQNGSITALSAAISGDLRLRYEMNPDGGAQPSRSRAAIRARLRASYPISDSISVGAELATGDPDDPNSSDVTLANFVDDFSVSLDQAYLRWDRGPIIVTGGKFVTPFVRNDLVWDADVHPQGIGAVWTHSIGKRANISLRGLYFLVDEAVAGPDATMAGAQTVILVPSSTLFDIEVSAAYYDYSLKTVVGGDIGDFRSNYRRADGSYLSDFNLLEGGLALNFNGLGARWPVRVVADFVHNFGAATKQDSGYAIDVSAGRANAAGEWRAAYGYAVAETDAVLAAFSHDNTSLATNYRQHSIAIDYALASRLLLNMSAWRYRPKAASGPGGRDAHWFNRLRLSILARF